MFYPISNLRIKLNMIATKTGSRQCTRKHKREKKSNGNIKQMPLPQERGPGNVSGGEESERKTETRYIA